MTYAPDSPDIPTPPAEGPHTNILYISPPPCFAHKTSHLVAVPADGFFAWQGGKLIQDAFPPEFSADRRETLMTGTCAAGWDLIEV